MTKHILLVGFKGPIRQVVGIAEVESDGTYIAVIDDVDISMDEGSKMKDVYCNKCALSMCLVVDAQINICQCCREKHMI